MKFLEPRKGKFRAHLRQGKQTSLVRKESVGPAEEDKAGTVGGTQMCTSLNTSPKSAEVFLTGRNVLSISSAICGSHE
jgi:hypothetical protein